MEELREWFEFDDMVQEWKKYNFDERLIRHMLEIGKLKGEYWKWPECHFHETKSSSNGVSHYYEPQPFLSPLPYNFRHLGIKSDSIIIKTAEVKRFKGENPDLFTPTAPEITTGPAALDLKPKDRNSLLTMVIAMAVKRYGYDAEAGRSTTPAEVAKDAAELGLSIDTKTVRKWLYEAAALLDKEKPL